MSDTPPTGAPEQGTAPAEAPSLAQSFEAALSEHEPEGTGESTTQEQAAPAPDAGTAVEEPEHVKWAKGIDGDWDPATGQFHTDRVLKRAFELNKQNQAAAQRLAQINQALQHPEIAAVLQKVYGQPQQQPAQPAKKEPEGEKTDEQILSEFVEERVKKLVSPIEQRAALVYQKYLKSEVELTRQTLREEFGKEGDAYVYDSVAPDVVGRLSAMAQEANTTLDQLVSYLVDRGKLTDTVREVTQTILYPKIREKAVQTQVQTQQKQIEQKKGTRLTSSGTPAKQVKPVKKVDSFADAVAAAEEELAQKGA